MPDSANSILNILMKLGVVEQQDVQLAQRLLRETAGATPETGDDNMTPASNGEIAGDAAKERGKKLESNPQLFAGINRPISGLGQDMQGLFEGPLGVAILLASAVLTVKQHLKDGDAGLYNVVGQKMAAHLIPNAGDETDPDEKQIEHIKAITDARLDACKKILEAFGHQEIAQVRARSTTLEHIAPAEERFRREVRSIDRTRPDIHLTDGRKVEPVTLTANLESRVALHQQVAQDRGKSAANGFMSQNGLTKEQRQNVETRILNHTLPMQRAFTGLERRVSQMEAQLRQTPYGGT